MGIREFISVLAGKAGKGVALCLEKKYNTSYNPCCLENIKSIWRRKTEAGNY